jgi:hypothetical protein
MKTLPPDTVAGAREALETARDNLKAVLETPGTDPRLAGSLAFTLAALRKLEEAAKR